MIGPNAAGAPDPSARQEGCACGGTKPSGLQRRIKAHGGSGVGPSHPPPLPVHGIFVGQHLAVATSGWAGVYCPRTNLETGGLG